jgi:hypothetical protein
MIPIFVVIAVLIATIVMVPILYFVAIPVCLVAIAVSISIPSYLPAAVRPAIISVMVIRVTTIGCVALILAEARIIAETRFILASPIPIFLLAFTVEPVVLDVVIPAFGKPLAVVRIILPVVAAISAVRVRIVSIPVLRASRGNDCPQSQR